MIRKLMGPTLALALAMPVLAQAPDGMQMRIDASTLSITPRWLIEFGIGTTCAARM